MPSQDVTDHVLEVRELRKEYYVHAIDRRVEALRGVNLTIGAGEHVALIGTSGAGKSTLLKTVWRSARPTSGEVLLRCSDGNQIDLATADDRLIAGLRGQEIAYVSQFLRAEARRSVLEVVSRAARRRGLEPDEAEKTADAALRRVDLAPELWDTHPVVLSGGEQQRVNLAAGTLLPPGLMLLDEPAASLDARNRRAVLDLIAGLCEAGVAVLSVFHDLDAVRRLATRVVVLERGQVVDDGKPDEILDSAAVAS